MKIGIIGANGYSGIELIRLLLQHPYVSIEVLISHSHHGANIREIYPHLLTLMNHQLEALDIEKTSQKVELMFFATPSGISKNLIPQFQQKGVKCIDVSGDFRLKDPRAYEIWYGGKSPHQKYLQQAVYGLADVAPNEIRSAQIIANPGCYPTAALLGLIPAVKQQIIDPETILIDGKSGVSGSGRKPSLSAHYGEVNENVMAYKLGCHQHTPEIEQQLSAVAGAEIKVTFTTHLVPMTRGIMCTLYGDLTKGISTSEVINLYEAFYEDRPFVRIKPIGEWPATKAVYGSNYCDIGLMVDQRTNRLLIISVIDNLVKGAAGQAVHNLNLMFGWNEETGINQTPIYP